MKILVSPSEALRLILKQITPNEGQIVSHQEVLGRTLSQNVCASLALPPFDNSAMDGYAVCAADLEPASASAPVTLQLLETIGAGNLPEQTVVSGTCSKIMTGAPLPRGADAVIMREETRQDAGNVTLLASVRQGENIRRAGSDVAKGAVVLKSGSVVGAAQWAMLASLGAAQIEVFRRPVVGIISTGAELVAVDADLAPGQIRDSNSYALRALVEQCGCEIGAVRHVGDTLPEFEAALHEVAAHCDVILSSGGVSAGDFDPVRDVLREKAEVFFWKIAMKPGKPVMFARFRGKLVFGLPGNPVSVMVAFEEFARPALLQMGGRRALQRLTVRARLSTGLSSPMGKVEYIRAQVRLENGEWQAKFPADQGSGRLSTMTNANALLVVDAETTLVKAGETLEAKLIDCPEIEVL